MPRPVEAALDATGLPWAAEVGTKHVHIRMAGKIVTVLGHGPMDESPGRAQNAIAAIRRAAREHSKGAA